MNISSITVRLPAVPTGINLAGFRPANSAAEGGSLNDEELEANLLCFHCSNGSIALVFGTIDTLFLDNSFEYDLLKLLKDKPELILIATHTHYAPLLAKSVSAIACISMEWYNETLRRLANAINSKCSDCEQIYKISYGCTCTELNINRRKSAIMLDYEALKNGKIRVRKSIAMAPNKNGERSRELPVVCLYDKSGVIRVVIWSLEAHNTINDDETRASSGYPGIARQYLREIFGYHVNVLFLPGLSGSVIPNLVAKPIWKRSKAELILSLLPLNPSIAPFCRTARSLWQVKLHESVLEAVEKANSGQKEEINSVRFNKSEEAVVFRSDEIQDKTVQVKCLRINEKLQFNIYNGELLSEWNKYFQVKSSVQHVIRTGYGMGDCLYIPPNNEIMEGGYEIYRFQSFFGLSGDFVSNIDEIIIGLDDRMFNESYLIVS